MHAHLLNQYRNGITRSLPQIPRQFPHITTRCSSSSSDLKEQLKRRRLPIIYDNIGPTPDRLLNLTLEDFLPRVPPSFTRNLKRERDPEKFVHPGHHLVYFSPQTLLSSLLPDGTDPLQSPGEPFVRRMWAGGRINFRPKVFATLRKECQAAACMERIVDVKIKGSEGDEKVFVTIDRRISRTNWIGPDHGEKVIMEKRHDEVRQLLFKSANCAVIEQRDLVFMRERTRDVAADAAKEPGKVVKPQHKATISHMIAPTPALLFRFSALTFNAHRIHLDKQYCSEMEGHRNLLVHGPLSVVLMLEVLRRHLVLDARKEGNQGENRLIEEIEYRNLAPLYAEESMKVCGRPLEDGKWELWIEGRDGGLAVRATVKTGPLWKPNSPKDPKELEEAEEAKEQAERGEDVEQVEEVEEVGQVEQAEDAVQQEQVEEEKREKQD